MKIAILLALFALVGAIDYDAQQADHGNRCDMVAAGHWPGVSGACLPPIGEQR